MQRQTTMVNNEHNGHNLIDQLKLLHVHKLISVTITVYNRWPVLLKCVPYNYKDNKNKTIDSVADRANKNINISVIGLD